MFSSNRPQRVNLILGGVLIGGLCLGVGALAWSTGALNRASASHTTSVAADNAAPAATPSANPSVTSLAPLAGADQTGAQGEAAASGPAASTFAVSCFSSGCTNSGTRASGPRDPARVNAAIAAGNARAAISAGGDADDVLAAWDAAEASGGGRDRNMIALMQTGQTTIANDDGEITVRSTLPNGRDLILRHDDTGADNGPRGPGG